MHTSLLETKPRRIPSAVPTSEMLQSAQLVLWFMKKPYMIISFINALWQLLWVNHVASPNLSKSTADVFFLKRHPLEFIQHRVSIVASDLLSQEIADHLLYPNPGSLMVHEQHLQYFHFLGTVLAKVQSGIAPSIYYLPKMLHHKNYRTIAMSPS
ncbi:E3 ubiquitin-protein ligase UPL6-like [Rhododendron vialii]|uniref:E3 ubiquitin-protein ligase UPL6-like n=1 Tax=Rhododendron vialii TaxID=182163 RepID=UPI00265D6537|nr:E3 ubiquitin-protein ligase UPL6-like [Rhododendron vialii]